MASVLYRIGAFTVRHRWQVIVGWVVLLAGLSVLVLVVQRPASNNLTIPGTQSRQALDLLNSRFPGAVGAQAQVVFSTTGTTPVTSSADEAAIEASLAQLRRAPQVVSVSDPFTTGTVSRSGKIALSFVAAQRPGRAGNRPRRHHGRRLGDDLGDLAEPYVDHAVDEHPFGERVFGEAARGNLDHPALL